jgi:phosphatidylglycerophosphate synthase
LKHDKRSFFNPGEKNMSMNEFKVGDRRPIPARNLPLSKKVATWLANSGASANGISIFGMLAGVGAGAAIAGTSYWREQFALLYVTGAVLILIRLLSNMFDGMVAVIHNRPNPLGELFNEVPDRISDAAILIGCGYSINSSPVAAYWAALFAILTAYIRAVGKACGAPQNFAGPLAKQQRMFLCIAACLISAFAPTTLLLIEGSSDIGSGYQSIMVPTLWFIAAGSALTCVRRLMGINAAIKSAGQ